MQPPIRPPVPSISPPSSPPPPGTLSTSPPSRPVLAFPILQTTAIPLPPLALPGSAGPPSVLTVNPLTDEPSDLHELDYNPADFDAHGSYSKPQLPFSRPRRRHGPRWSFLPPPPDFLSGSGGPVEISLNHTFHSSKQMDGTQASFRSIDFPSNGSLPPRVYSPRPDYSAPSPASSAGLPAEQEHIARSRASSFSSMVRQPTPGVSEAFDKLAFDTVDSDLALEEPAATAATTTTAAAATAAATATAEQQNTKPNSPPQLFIPSESANTSLQIPSFGPSLGRPRDGRWGLGLAAPSINLLPATPVSGGASGNHVPFQQVLRNLNEQRQQQSQGENGLNSMSSHGKQEFLFLEPSDSVLPLGHGQCPPRR
jgi:hypothetical protein